MTEKDFDEKIKYWVDKYAELERHSHQLQVNLDAECALRRELKIKLETARAVLQEQGFIEFDKGIERVMDELKAAQRAQGRRDAAEAFCDSCDEHDETLIGCDRPDHCWKRKAILGE